MDQFIGEPDYWNRGIGSEFLQMMASYLKTSKGTACILLDPHKSNSRAIRAYEKGVISEYDQKSKQKDLSRIAEIQIFNYRLYFYPIFQSDAYFFDELQVPSLIKDYEGELDSLYVYDDGVVKGFIKIEGTYIARLFVEPVLQNASIGSRLLEFAVNERHGFFATGEKKLEDGTEEYLILLKRK